MALGTENEHEDTELSLCDLQGLNCVIERRKRMKMKFTVEQYTRDCLKHEVPLNAYGFEWCKVIDGWIFEFEDGSKSSYKNGFAVSKDWCEPVKEKTASDMFAELGFVRSEGQKHVEYDFENEDGESLCTITFYKEKKTYDAYNNEDYDAMQINAELLQAITQEFKERGWL